MDQISFSQLIAYLQDKLTVEEKANVERRLSQSEELQEELDQARMFLNTSQTHKEQQVPRQPLVNRVLAAFRQKQRQLEERIEAVAKLEYDSWESAAALGTRGGVPQTRQMLFHQGGIDLDLEVSQDSRSGVLLRGQILDGRSRESRLTGLELSLSDAEGSQRRSLTDEFGRFTFTELTPGTYSLKVALDDRDLHLRSLDIEV